MDNYLSSSFLRSHPREFLPPHNRGEKMIIPPSERRKEGRNSFSDHSEIVFFFLLLLLSERVVRRFKVDQPSPSCCCCCCCLNGDGMMMVVVAEGRNKSKTRLKSFAQNEKLKTLRGQDEMFFFVRMFSTSNVMYVQRLTCLQQANSHFF